MRFLSRAKDGGPKSTVTGYWLVEIKWLFSIVLLKFEDGSRDEYHTHAFNSVNWVLGPGRLEEQFLGPRTKDKVLWRIPVIVRKFARSIWPIYTRRKHFHRVVSRGTTWVFSIRGPWVKTWREYDPKTDEFVTLTHGRIRV